jgi:hypothetical protein
LAVDSKTSSAWTAAVCAPITPKSQRLNSQE